MSTTSKPATTALDRPRETDESVRGVRILTVTVSDSRTAETDEGGRCLRSGLERAGYCVVGHRIIADEVDAIRAVVAEVLGAELADAVIMTGGTGIARRDCTIEALEPLLDKKLDGFGEALRRLSWEQVGPRAVLSRSLAGTCRGRFVAALPGSPRAVALAVEALLAPILGHAVALLRGQTLHAAPVPSPTPPVSP